MATMQRTYKAYTKEPERRASSSSMVKSSLLTLFTAVMIFKRVLSSTHNYSSLLSVAPTSSASFMASLQMS